MTLFAKKVYRIVLRIPLGQTRTYKWVAQQVSRPKASRAVGQILAANPYPLIIPCHRVVKSNNKLGGYILGKEAKQRLLELEREIKKILTTKKDTR